MSKQISQQSELSDKNQGDLFGESQPEFKAYIPKEEHVRNSLSSLLEKMKTAEKWPWNAATVRMHKNTNFEYLCALLQDKDEAEQWRKSIKEQIERLDKFEN